MKRSLVNASIRYAKKLLEKNNFKLPEFGYWSLEEWKKHKDEIDVIKQLMLGWDMTDHGLGRFDEIGYVLFTIRNGLLDNPEVGVPYAEKLLIFKDGQRLPIHYHGFKTEDIINRGGEVSKINDDNIDNYHIELQPQQYADIDEDEAILHPLCNEYERVLR